jgi:ribonucleotide reductase beta subunit family protein with ferritin-like domain
MPNMLKLREVYKPFEYPQAFDFMKLQQNNFWLPSEASMTQDKADWKSNITESERNVLGQILKSFIQTEIHVNEYWSSKVSKWFPKPEIQMMSSTFAAFEAIHQEGYDYLNVELDIADYSAFLQDSKALAKLNRLKEVRGNKKEDIARSLAIFSGFTEGVNLYSAFAILANMSRFGYMMGLKNIIAWSQRDECLTDGHEVLTPDGWVDLKDFDVENMKVAQYNPENNQIDFVKASRKVENFIDEEVINFTGKNRAIEQTVTKNHRIPTRYIPNGIDKGVRVVTAENFSLNSHNYMLLSGELSGDVKKLSNFERFLIAAQADGSISDRYTGEICGTRPVNFSFSKQRKIDRFFEIVNSCNFSYKELPISPQNGNRKEQRSFKVNVPIDLFNSVPDMKLFSWIKIEHISSEWIREFLDEVLNWDGHRVDNNFSLYYSSSIRSNAETVSTLCHLAGMSATLSDQEDARSEEFSTMHRVFFSKQNKKQGKGITKELVQYKGMVRCLTVPTGFFLVRNKDCISITGNCLHSVAGCWLFREFIKENPEIWTKEFKASVYEAARISVELEDNFIDSVFSLGEIRGLDPKDLKSFIRNQANDKLIELGLKTNWKNLDQNSLEKMAWFGTVSDGISNVDFFSSRVTEYSKVNFTMENMFDE